MKEAVASSKSGDAGAGQGQPELIRPGRNQEALPPHHVKEADTSKFYRKATAAEKAAGKVLYSTELPPKGTTIVEFPNGNLKVQDGSRNLQAGDVPQPGSAAWWTAQVHGQKLNLAERATENPERHLRSLRSTHALRERYPREFNQIMMAVGRRHGGPRARLTGPGAPKRGGRSRRSRTRRSPRPRTQLAHACRRLWIATYPP